MPVDDDCVSELLLDVVTRLVREKVAELLHSGHNWKLTLHGSAGGDVRAVVETYQTVAQQYQVR